MIKFKFLNTFKGLDLVSTAHDYLEKNACWNLSFLEHLELSGSIGEGTGWHPLPLLVEKDKKNMGLVPMFIKSHSYGEYVFDWSWAEAFERYGFNYYPKLLIGLPFTPVPSNKFFNLKPEFIGQLVDFIEDFSLKNKISSVHYLFESAEGEGQFFSSDTWAQRKTLNYLWENNQYASFDDFLNTLTHEKRKKIKQDQKKVQQAGVTFKTFDQDISDDLLEFAYHCYENTYHLHNSRPYIKKPFFMKFYKENMQKSVLFFAFIDDKPIACSICLRDKYSLYGRHWGAINYVPSLHFDLSYYLGIKYAIEHNYKYFYAGVQGEHKLARGFKPILSNSYHFIANPEFRKAIFDFVDQDKRNHELYFDELNERKPYKNRD